MGYRIVRVSQHIFEHLFTQGRTYPNEDGRRLVVSKGLPPGAELVAISNQAYFCTRDIALRFEHPDWPDPPPGTPTPEVSVEFTMEEIDPPPAIVRESP